MTDAPDETPHREGPLTEAARAEPGESASGRAPLQSEHGDERSEGGRLAEPFEDDRFEDDLEEERLEEERQAAARRELQKHDRVRSAVEWVAVIVGALVVALVVKTFLFQAFYIPSASMEPTLQEGDRVLVNKLSYDAHDVHRGDVVVFELPEEEVGPDGIKDLIKRVIGLPGDTIESRDGAVYIDDRRLEEPYLPDGTLTGDSGNGTNPAITRQVVPEGMVFVMGDNRANSHDSRYADRGPIPIDSIVGRAFVLVWPPGDIGSL